MKLNFFILSIFVIALFSCGTAEQEAATHEATTTKATASTAAPVKAVRHDLTAAKFKEMMAQEGVVLLDARTPKEHAAGNIEPSINVDVLNPNFKSEIEKLDKSKTYLVYCRSGSRSLRATKMMLDAGFTDIYNLLGGYNGWPK